tara:strand:+ start:931 stop:1146 length:216 start_codon:yes stop_codon:yes gene_type:complete
MIQFNELVINMKKLLLILMIATTLAAMATCLLCKKTNCEKAVQSYDDIEGKEMNVEDFQCDEYICKRLFTK